YFVIADAIVCMEGNGPLAGTARRLDCIVLSDEPVAGDATCTRMMGLVPERVPHIAETAKFLGNMSSDRIDQVASTVISPAVSFETVPEFEYLCTSPRAAS